MLRMSPRCRMSCTCSVSFRYSTCRLPSANTPKPSAANAAIDVRIVAIFLSRRERGLHRRLRGVLVFDDLAEHVVLLELAAWRFLHEERASATMPPGCRARRTPTASPRVPPAMVGERAMTDEQRAQSCRAPAGPRFIDRRHAGADADRVVVGEQRRVHRDVVGLGDAGEADAPEQHERR